MINKPTNVEANNKNLTMLNSTKRPVFFFGFFKSLVIVSTNKPYPGMSSTLATSLSSFLSYNLKNLS